MFDIYFDYFINCLVYLTSNPGVDALTTNQLWTRLGEQHTDYQGLYNGNIAWMQTDLPGLQDKPEQAMLYRYDQLNRLVLARGLNQYDAATGFAARSGSTGPYDAAYSYDPNGNLLSLDRHKQDGSLLDEFAYSYTANTNRLASLTDASVETITYDEKIYSSGPIRHNGHVYRSIIAKDNASINIHSSSKNYHLLHKANDVRNR